MLEARIKRPMNVSDDSAGNKDSLVDWEDALRIEDEEEEEFTGKTEPVSSRTVMMKAVRLLK